MKLIYAIVGDYYHREEVIQEALSLALRPLTEGGVYALQYISEEGMAAALAEKPAAVILFKENRINPRDEQVREWLTEETVQAVARYVEDGGGWLSWHSGLASYPQDSAYIRMLRGYFLHHPAKHQMVQYTGQLPAEANKSASVQFAILDEHYFVHCDEANTNVFLRSESIDGSSIGGWFHPYGKGRVCCITPAHNKEGLLDPNMLELLRSSVQRCLG